ncbi:hypothetical protein [Streptomyces sp. NBC_01750]|uniref:hypothetical protein n=1 Tax=Streptomyces sp. NBC_01750 TaxID=2975928 RepID=UPI002DDC62C3|nr:hypothetical protein [Streptomyces sp. NBC_01750]WSD38130.1 hypothetical protein OG966_40220 [Streptomyces sp. NBC_01750]
MATTVVEGGGMPEAAATLQDVRDLLYGRAIESVSTVAAPLLAGGAVAMLGVLAADADKFRWPGPSLLLLALAAISLVACVQWGFRARTFLYSVSEAEEHYDGTLSADERELWMQRSHEDLIRWRRGTGLAALCYNLGLVAFGAGISLAVAPPAHAAQAGWRWAAFWMVSLATASELLWVLLEWGDAASRAATQRRWLRRARARSREGTPQ